VSGASSAAQDEELAIAGAEAAKVFGSEDAGHSSSGRLDAVKSKGINLFLRSV